MNELLEKMNREVVGTGPWEFASLEWCQCNVPASLREMIPI